MSVETAPQPVAETVDDGDGLRHDICCDPNRGLCGADMSTGLWVDGYDADSPENCIVCEELWKTQRPCGAVGCRLRRIVRRWRS